jgi:hypothetical protein
MYLLGIKWLFLLITALHPFYVSVTEIHHNQKEKSLEITCKVFIDDMEDALRKSYKTKVDFSNDELQIINNKLVADYFTKRLILSADGKPVKLNFIGYEKDSESVYCYFEVPNVVSVKKLDMINSILQDYIDSQINIVHVTFNGNRKSYKLDYPHKQVSFTF